MQYIVDDIKQFSDKLKQADISFVFTADLNGAVASCGHASDMQAVRLIATSIAEASLKTDTPVEEIIADVATLSVFYRHCIQSCDKIPTADCLNTACNYKEALPC